MSSFLSFREVQARGREQADELDRLRRECEPVDRLGIGVQKRQAGRHRQRVADEQAGEHGGGGRSREHARRAERHRDRQRGEQHGRCDEAEPRGRGLGEMVGRERAVDPGADRTRDDDEIAPELDRRHLTITVPDMSWRCSVQT
jgi:hypothetical protein